MANKIQWNDYVTCKALLEKALPLKMQSETQVVVYISSKCDALRLILDSIPSNDYSSCQHTITYDP